LSVLEFTAVSQQRSTQSPDSQRAFINQNCLSCHDRDSGVYGIAFDDPKNDVAHVTDNRTLWEKVVRRLRMGIGEKDVPLPAPAVVNSFIQYLETELDRNARAYVPQMGPHRLNRTEYANAIRDLLDLEIDTKQLLPPDYSFFNVATSLDSSSRSRDAYVSVAPVVSRLAVQSAPNSSSYQRIFSCRYSTTFDRERGWITEYEACLRKIVTNLTETAFRGSATTADIDAIIAAAKSVPDGFDEKVMAAVAQILSSPKFLYRADEAPVNAKTGDAYRISDTALASRLAFFLWSTAPDTELIDLAKQGKLHEPSVLEQQTLRMLQDYRAEALSLNFARQWLGIGSFQELNLSQAFFPEFDDSLQQAMIKETELFFDSVVREDRGVTDLLTANYTFVNNRLARFYGIPGVSGSQFRRVTLPAALDVRRGILGKAAFLTTANYSFSKNRTSPVERGKWVLTALFGIRPPDPPPDEGSLRQRSNDPSVVEPPVRQMMEDLKNSSIYRESCISCHRYTDPIGYALENFNAIGAWRTEDGGLPINAADTLIDGTRVNGPVELRNWLVSHSDLFVETLTQKLLTYALGRETDAMDLPLIRSIDREAARNGNRFSSIILGIVKSDSFQMNSK